MTPYNQCHFSLQQDQLVKVTEGMILRDDKYIVPEALQKPVIKLYHDYAHVSAPKTQQLIQKNFWWPQMASDIQRWCDTCIVCATINQGKPGRTKLCRPEPPKGPWELLQLDFIGPLPSAKGGYRYCLVIIDSGEHQSLTHNLKCGRWVLLNTPRGHPHKKSQSHQKRQLHGLPD